MKHTIKSRVLLWLSSAAPWLILLALFLASPSHAATAVPAKERIADVAKVLSPAEKAALESVSKQIEDQTGAVLVAVLVPHLDGETIEEYSERLHTAWKPGLDNDGRGSILIIATSDRKLRIAPTRAMGVKYTDARTAHVINEMKPYLKKMEYASAVTTYLTHSAAFAGKAEPSVAPVVAAATVSADDGTLLAQIVIGGLIFLTAAFGAVTIRNNLRNAREEAKHKAIREQRQREHEEAMERERVAAEARRSERERKLAEAPDRVGYTKSLVLDSVVYIRNDPSPREQRERQQVERNANIRNEVNAERFTKPALVTTAGYAAVAPAMKAQIDREAEARRQRQQNEEDARRKQRQRDADEQERRRRRERDEEDSRRSYSTASYSSSSSSSDFSSSSSSSSDGGGSTGDY